MPNEEKVRITQHEKVGAVERFVIAVVRLVLDGTYLVNSIYFVPSKFLSLSLSPYLDLFTSTTISHVILSCHQTSH